MNLLQQETTLRSYEIRFIPRILFRTLCSLLILMAGVVGCGGGGTASDQGAADSTCDGSCGTEQAVRLSVSDVETVIAQAVAEAKAQGVRATVAVADRVGNVLGVFRMRAAECELNAAICSVTVSSGRLKADGSSVEGGLEDISVIPDTLAAISKAITGAFLASEGNAFTTRTASQIVQEHFNPGERNQPAGPLFGVQFSQLPCSDFNTRFNGAAGASAGPHRSPLGLSADVGGLPLYKDGVPVGGVGVIADGLYSLDLNILDLDRDIDELLATAATRNFSAPANRRADRITVDGKVLRFSDVDFSDVATGNDGVVPLSSLPASDGSLVAVRGYSDGSVVNGTAFGFAESGIRADGGETFDTEVDGEPLDAFVIVDDNNVPRFAPKDSTDGLLTAGEVKSLLQEALAIANRARGQIRVPLGSQARVSISVVDTNGEILGVIRSRDAPVFGLDVGLQKARTAAFFSGVDAAGDLQATPPAQYLSNNTVSSIADYVSDVREFLGDSSALTGTVAFADRSGGNLSRPYFPDGIRNNVNGPLSKPIDEWSPFTTGLQLDLVNNAILKHTLFVLNGGSDTGPGECTGLPVTSTGKNRLQNGIQIFPGSVPIYRGSQLVGGIGVSGDGIDQDDMISFLGLNNAGEKLGTINQAPVAFRADQLRPQGERLRFVNCPQAPFLDSEEQAPCSGK